MMAHMGVWVRLALLLTALMLVCSFALAEEASLKILSCEQQGDQVVLNFVCLDENNAQVALSLDAADWTVRGAESSVDMQVDRVSRYTGGVHFIFAYEASAGVGSEAYSVRTLSQCIEAMKSCVDELKLGDSLSVVQLGKKTEIILNHASNKTDIVTALNKLKKNSQSAVPQLYDQIDEALGQLKREAGERTVMLILSTGIDNGSKLTKFDLAQRLGNAQVSVYPVLVKERTDSQSASGLEALCVRGGHMLQADKVKNQNEMVTFLKSLLPDVRNTYTLTARATDASYNSKTEMLLRVFVRHNGGKISGEAYLTTDHRMYTVVAPQVTSTPKVSPTPSAAPVVEAASNMVSEPPVTEATATPTAVPVAEVTDMPPEMVPAAEQADDPAVMTYVLLGGGALVAVAAVVLVIVLVTGKSKKAKGQKRGNERLAANINPNFGVKKEVAAPASKAAPAKEEKPVETSKTPPPPPAQTSTTNPADFFNSDPVPVAGSKPASVQPAPQPKITWNMTVEERKEAPAQSTGWERTMDERQVQQRANLDVTQDERQVQPAQPVGFDETRDERQVQPAQPVGFDVTRDERQVQPAQPVGFDVTRDERQVQAVHPVGFDETKDEHQVQSAQPVVQMNASPAQPAASMADQTVKSGQWEPHLILSITDTDGTREVAKPLTTGGEITIGRENTDILLDRHDRSISRQHMSIKLTANSLVVVDHSGNGTMVDGQMLRHSETRLTIGSEMKLGGLDEAAVNSVATVIRVKEFRYPGAIR